jgi:hypothetical protein
MSKKMIPIFAALFVTAASAQNLTANGFSYDYIQADVGNTNVITTVDGDLLEADYSETGLSIRKLLTENLFFTASISSAYSDSIKINLRTYAYSTDISSTSFGVGYRMPIDSKTDFNVRLRSTSSKIKIDGYGYSLSDNDSYTSIGATVRHKLIDDFELYAAVNSTDGEVSTNFGGVMKLSETVALVGGLAASDDASGSFIGLQVMY